MPYGPYACQNKAVCTCQLLKAGEITDRFHKAMFDLKQNIKTALQFLNSGNKNLNSDTIV